MQEDSYHLYCTVNELFDCFNIRGTAEHAAVCLKPGTPAHHLHSLFYSMSDVSLLTLTPSHPHSTLSTMSSSSSTPPANTKHPAVPRRYAVLLLACASLLATALLADFLWASSSSASSSSHSSSLNPSLDSFSQVDDSVPASPRCHGSVKKKKERKAVDTELMSLNATYADIPAPHLDWEEMPEAPVPRLDGFSVQIDNLMYVFAGYGSIDHVHSHVDIFNFTDNTWGGRFDMPREMANSHLGMATDGRYIYAISGQYGPQCRPATNRNFVLDTKTKQWSVLPSLPVPRYAPATQLWRGRLHVMGGSKEDRHEPGLEHWSLAVKDGKALETGWRVEVPIPRGGPHRACVVANDKLLVIGGQEGDFMPKPGSPIFKCSRRHEVVYTDVYVLDDDKEWKELPPMPKPNSHIEAAWVIVDNSIIIVGGTTEKHPVTKKMILVGEVFRFNLDILEWSVIGRMPFRMKTTLVGFWDGWLYFTSGQRDRGPNDPSPRKVVGSTWRTKLHL